MADRMLRKLRREELLQMLLEMEQENERLAAENRELKKRLEQREVAIAESGSLAEAALKLSGVFEAAQAAADLYLENIQRVAGQTQSEGGDERV